MFLLICSFILLLNLINSRHDLSLSNSLLLKLTHSFKEISIAKSTSLKEINVNYRGYESYRSLKTYIEGNPLELVFGQGLGKLIDLNANVFLGA